MLAAYLLHIHDEGYASDYNSDEWYEWNESDGDYTSEEEEEEDEGIVEDSDGFSSYYYNSDEDQWFYPNDEDYTSEEEDEDEDLL